MQEGGDVSERDRQDQPRAVPQQGAHGGNVNPPCNRKGESGNPSPKGVGARRRGEVRARWAWTEACVWSERMLTALEDGVKGGKWYGPMPSLLRMGCSPQPQPMKQPVNPL